MRVMRVDCAMVGFWIRSDRSLVGFRMGSGWVLVGFWLATYKSIRRPVSAYASAALMFCTMRERLARAQTRQTPPTTNPVAQPPADQMQGALYAAAAPVTSATSFRQISNRNPQQSARTALAIHSHTRPLPVSHQLH